MISQAGGSQVDIVGLTLGDCPHGVAFCDWCACRCVCARTWQPHATSVTSRVDVGSQVLHLNQFFLLEHFPR